MSHFPMNSTKTRTKILGISLCKNIISYECLVIDVKIKNVLTSYQIHKTLLSANNKAVFVKVH